MPNSMPMRVCASAHTPNYSLIGKLAIQAKSLTYLGEMVFSSCSIPIMTVESLAEPATQELSGPASSKQYVTLSQCAAMVHRSKRTLEKHRDQMPAPFRVGGGGRSSVWLWSEVRVWLQTYYGRVLPEVYPGESS